MVMFNYSIYARTHGATGASWAALEAEDNPQGRGVKTLLLIAEVGVKGVHTNNLLI